MKKIVIIDYGMGNLKSLYNAIKFLKYNPVISSKASDIEKADLLFLPGVGSFSQAMENIKFRNIDQAIYDFTLIKQRPFMGICLGMQLLANNGIENGLTSGLGLIDGEIIELQATNLRVPHVGFNEIAPQKEHTIFNNISENPDFYFTHSFKFNAKFEQEIICTTHYGENFVSGVNKNNIYGFQFHPEKSQFNGLKLLSNFCSKL